MKKQSLLSKLVGAPYIVWSAIFIVIPLAIVVYYSFTDRSGAATLDNFKTIADPGFINIFWKSIRFSVIATCICLFIAYPFAYSVAKMKKSTQSMMMLLIMLPMWMNLIIRTYSLVNLLEKNGLINSFLKSVGFSPIEMMGTSGAIIFGMVYNYLPYMILPIYTAIAKIEPNLLEAADDLGASAWQRLRRVVFPLSLPGVISGITMVFVPCVSTFYISKVLGNNSPGNVLIGDLIEDNVRTNYNFGSALSLILMVFIIISIIVMNHFTDSEEGGIVA